MKNIARPTGYRGAHTQSTEVGDNTMPRQTTQQAKKAAQAREYRKKRGTWWKNPVECPQHLTPEQIRATLAKHESDLPRLEERRQRALDAKNQNPRDEKLCKAYTNANHSVFVKRKQIEVWRGRVESLQPEGATT